jgi:hypothetical protein
MTRTPENCSEPNGRKLKYFYAAKKRMALTRINPPLTALDLAHAPHRRVHSFGRCLGATPRFEVGGAIDGITARRLGSPNL